jgi:HD-like signal output (HDOD) protein
MPCLQPTAMPDTLTSLSTDATATGELAATLASPDATALTDATALPDAAPTEEDETAARRAAALQRLFDRMSQHADFPSLRDSIRTIQSVARSETAHMRAFSEQILQDVALSAKLLRLINAAFYSSAGAGSITTVNRAIALMGFQPVGRLASSIALLDRLPKQGPHLDRIRTLFARALLAGMLAHEFCPSRQLEETAYIAALFQPLGELLVWLHFPDDALAIEEASADATDDPQHDVRAQRDALGLSYEELGLEVAHQWGWPAPMQAALRPLRPSDPEQPVPEQDYMRVLCTAANELADQLVNLPDPEHAAKLPEFFKTWGVPLSLGEDDLEPMLERARGRWQDMAMVLSLGRPRAASPSGGKSAAGKPVPGAASRQAPSTAASRGTSGTSGATGAGGPNARPAPAARIAPLSPQAQARITQALSQGVEQLSQTAMSEAPLAQVLQQALQIMLEALQLRRVVACLRHEASGQLQGCLGAGEQGMTLARAFHIPIDSPADLFGMLCLKAADTLISDSSDALIARHLPAWFHQQVQAPTFLVLPMTQARPGRAPLVLGMLYGDRSPAGSLQIDERQLGLLKTLRNQLVLALRLRGAG